MMHDAQPNDVYVDAQGKLWRVIWKCGEPTVGLKEIESETPASPLEMSGGVSGQIWDGFQRIYRRPEDAS